MPPPVTKMLELCLLDRTVYLAVHEALKDLDDKLGVAFLHENYNSSILDHMDWIDRNKVFKIKTRLLTDGRKNTNITWPWLVIDVKKICCQIL
jgi:hypothetical protein